MRSHNRDGHRGCGNNKKGKQIQTRRWKLSKNSDLGMGSYGFSLGTILPSAFHPAAPTPITASRVPLPPQPSLLTHVHIGQWGSPMTSEPPRKLRGGGARRGRAQDRKPDPEEVPRESPSDPFVFSRAQSGPVLLLSAHSPCSFSRGSPHESVVETFLASSGSEDFWQSGHLSPLRRSICQTLPLARPSRLCLAEASDHIPHMPRRAPGESIQR